MPRTIHIHNGEHKISVRAFRDFMDDNEQRREYKPTLSSRNRLESLVRSGRYRYSMVLFYDTIAVFIKPLA